MLILHTQWGIVLFRIWGIDVFTSIGDILFYFNLIVIYCNILFLFYCETSWGTNVLVQRSIIVGKPPKGQMLGWWGHILFLVLRLVLYLPVFLLRIGLLTLMCIAFCMALAIFYSSLLIIFKFLTVVVRPVILWCSKIGHGAFKCSLYHSSEVLDNSPYILIITFSLATLKPLYTVTLFGYCFFVLWEHWQVFQSIPSLKMHLGTIFSIDGFVAFT